MDYRGAIAVVTGGSSGLGRRFALDLAGRGAIVVVVARRAGALAEVAERLRASTPASSSQVCDVAQTDEWQAALREIETRYGRIDLLINAAAIEQRTTVQQRELDLYRRTFDVNFFGAVTGTLTVLPGMLARGEGAVVNVSSDSGRAPGAGSPPYNASKAALSAFTESVAFEVAGRGVHLHVLYPGWVPTAMGMHAVDAGMPKPPRVVRRSERQVSRLLLRRIGHPSIDINAARVAVLAPVVRALAPALYRRQMTGR